MQQTICVAAYTLRYLEGGAYMWAFLNWALGLRALGFRVIWLDSVLEDMPEAEIIERAGKLKTRLAPHGLADDLAVVRRDGSPLHVPGCLSALEIEYCEILIDLGYDLDVDIVKRFARSVFVDIDPGLTQVWLKDGDLHIAPHRYYFTYGETVGEPGSKVPDCGLPWLYTPPPIFLAAWQLGPPPPAAPFTTVSSWWGEWLVLDGRLVDNSKRAAFMEFLPLPAQTTAKLELALPITSHEADTTDLRLLVENGWSVRQAAEVSATPRAFQDYIAYSRGEFSCLKRGYRVLETAWMSERTLNYLASGRPAVIQHTGRSRILPDAEGLFRFRTTEEAARYLDNAQLNYEFQSKAARSLVEEHFDSAKVLTRVLERVMA